MNLDLLDEVREEARLKAEAVKRRIERRYNLKVMPRQFREGDLVMRKAHQYEMENKLSPKGTGPFRITEALGNGAYRLETLEGGAIPRTWNATHLKLRLKSSSSFGDRRHQLKDLNALARIEAR